LVKGHEALEEDITLSSRLKEDRHIFTSESGSEVKLIASIKVNNYALDNHLRVGRSKMVIRHNPLFQTKLEPSDPENLQSENAGEHGGYDSGPSSFPTALCHVAMKATGEGCGES